MGNRTSIPFLELMLLLNTRVMSDISKGPVLTTNKATLLDKATRSSKGHHSR
jgi:hypothetical protein